MLEPEPRKVLKLGFSLLRLFFCLDNGALVSAITLLFCRIHLTKDYCSAMIIKLPSSLLCNWFQLLPLINLLLPFLNNWNISVFTYQTFRVSDLHGGVGATSLLLHFGWIPKAWGLGHIVSYIKESTLCPLKRNFVPKIFYVNQPLTYVNLSYGIRQVATMGFNKFYEISMPAAIDKFRWFHTSIVEFHPNKWKFIKVGWHWKIRGQCSKWPHGGWPSDFTLNLFLTWKGYILFLPWNIVATFILI